MSKDYKVFKTVICFLCIAVIHCGAPRELLHGTLINLTSRYYDGVAYYSCDIGFSMIGSEKVTCLEDGWTEMPNCESESCLC